MRKGTAEAPVRTSSQRSHRGSAMGTCPPHETRSSDEAIQIPKVRENDCGIGRVSARYLPRHSGGTSGCRARGGIGSVRTFPPLSSLVANREWTAAWNESGRVVTYGQAFLAFDRLLERAGLDPVLAWLDERHAVAEPPAELHQVTRNVGGRDEEHVVGRAMRFEVHLDRSVLMDVRPGIGLTRPGNLGGVASGRPLAGERMLFADSIRIRASACASALSGTWTAIWSPSKSALKA